MGQAQRDPESRNKSQASSCRESDSLGSFLGVETRYSHNQPLRDGFICLSSCFFVFRRISYHYLV
jgi:hypothetical protein